MRRLNNKSRMKGDFHVRFGESQRGRFPLATRPVCHCKTETQVNELKEKLSERMIEVGLELHPEKTKIVYCKDGRRSGNFSCTVFDFLSYTFRARRVKSMRGEYLVGFNPGISNASAKEIRNTSRDWHWSRSTDKSLEDLARMFNPIIQGWINYYGKYYKSALFPTLLCLDRRLVIWATRKFKRFRGHRRRAALWLSRVARREPNLFAHWKVLYA